MKQKMKLKLVRKIFWCLLALGTVLGLTGACHSMALAVAGIIVMLCAMLFYLVFYRCPIAGNIWIETPGKFAPIAANASTTECRHRTVRFSRFGARQPPPIAKNYSVNR